MLLAKKTFALLFAVAIMLTATFGVFAATPYNVKRYSLYTAIGDSIPAGLGMDDDTSWRGTDLTPYAFARIEGSYPDLVADMLRPKDAVTDNFASLTCVGLRVIDLYYLLGGEIEDMETFHANGSNIISEEFHNEYVMNYRDKFDFDAIRNADVITIQVGINDLYSQANVVATQYKDDPVKRLEVLLDGMWTGYWQFMKYYPKTYELLSKYVSDDCEVLIVGNYNTYENLSITQYNDTIIGDIVGIITRSANAMAKAMAYKYGYTYVNIEDTVDYVERFQKEDLTAYETIPEKIGAAFIHGRNMHPDRNGHAHIAERIVEYLPSDMTKSSIRTGTATVEIAGKVAGDYIITKGVDGWLLQDLYSGLYVTYNNGTIELTEEGTQWSYDSGFYVEANVSTGIIFKRTSKNKVYLTVNNNVLTTALVRNIATFYKAKQ